MEGTDLLDGFTNMKSKLNKKMHHVLLRVEVCNNEKEIIQSYSTHMHAYVDGFVDVLSEEFLFENVLSTYFLHLSLYITRDGPNEYSLECAGFLSIPINRLEEDIPVSMERNDFATVS